MADSKIWYPFTPLSANLVPQKVVGGSGARLRLADGRELIDAISSWWVNLHGHGHPAIAEAIAEQARTLEHVIFAGFTHEPAERLAGLLAEALPPGLDRVFYSDNGSTAVEVALKVAWQYWRNRGEARRDRIVAFDGAYHGDTFGAMSAGARSTFSAPFEPLLFAVDRAPWPHTWDGDAQVETKEAAALDWLRQAFERHPDGYAACILEPLVQGAGGMRMVRPAFVARAVRLAREFGVLVIFDEVMTGFGRTGERFAFERVGEAPDLLCLSKGITGGFLPLAVTVVRDTVQAAFDSPDPVHTLWHGHSYTANPLGCAAAVASWALTEAALPVVRAFEARHRDLLRRFQPRADRIRVCGTIVAMDVPGRPGGYHDPVGPALRQAFLDDGVLLRPLGDTVYAMPPYCMTDAELEAVYATITRRLAAL